MTLYERLIKDLKHGKYPVVVDKDGDLRIFYHIGEDGTLLSYGAKNTIPEFWYVGYSPCWSQQEIEDYADRHGWKFHSYFYPSIEPYKVGQKVRVSKEILKEDDLVPVIKKMVENETIVEIVTQGNYSISQQIYGVKESDKNDEWFIHHTYLEPVYDEEPTITKGIVTGKQIGRAHV